MHLISEILASSLEESEFSSFAEFEAVVLSKDKSLSMISVLELALRSTSIGQAFAAGYRCALQHLMPELSQNCWAAFCITEEAGTHPKSLTTKVSGSGVLNGIKSFVSMADSAKELIVIANTDTRNGIPCLKAVKVQLPCVGAEISVMPNMGMMPDISHGKLILNNVQGELLEGDGYLDFSRRFRVIEDAHIMMAFSGLILSKVLRHKLNDSLIDDCLFIISFLLKHELSDTQLNTLQLNGVNNLLSEVIKRFECELSEISSDFEVAWKRDSSVFSLAKKTRQLKRQKAIKTFFN